MLHTKTIKILTILFLLLWLGTVSGYCRSLSCAARVSCHRIVTVIQDHCFKAPIHCQPKSCQPDIYPHTIQTLNEFHNDKIQLNTIHFIPSSNQKENQRYVDVDINSSHQTSLPPLFILNQSLIC